MPNRSRSTRPSRRPAPARPSSRLWLLSLGIGVALSLVATSIFFLTRTDPVSPASPASAAVPGSVLSADTRMGTVELEVADLETMTAFYSEGVGLEVLDRADSEVTLGAGSEELLRLVFSDADPATPSEAGLCHSAILFPDAPALARSLMSMNSFAPASFQGSSDHVVSNAFYFGDPEGNGVELYVDKPRSEWVWKDGKVQMGSLPLDPSAFVEEHLEKETSGSATLGHVHLKVGDIESARKFYVDTLGFAVTAESDGALFMSAGGYHHHLATNTWESLGAQKRSSSLGLGSFEVVLKDASELDSVADRLEAASLPLKRSGSTLQTSDPWGNSVVFTLG